MQKEGHRKFGKIFVEEYDVPIDPEWARAPDYGVWFKEESLNYIFHRFTLHGMSNVDKTIELIKERDLINYKEEYRDEIRTLVVSHNFLDLFNGIIFPSCPSSLEFKLIPNQILKYPIVCLDDPDNLDKIFREIITDSFSEERDVIGLNINMRKEYSDLPWEKGKLIKKILKHYKKYS